MDVQEAIELRLVHEIHTSERRSYRGCRRRWDWIFRQNYYPIMTAKPLEFGTAFHKAMEVYYEPETWNMDREVVGALAKVAFVEVCETQRKAALAAQGRESLDEEVQADYNERVQLGLGMIDYHLTTIAPRFDTKHWRPVKVEQAFMVPIPHPDTGENMYCKCAQCWERYCKYVNRNLQPGTLAFPLGFNGQEIAERINFWDGLLVVYAGRIDMIAVDDKGGLWIFDWKTAARLTESGERDEFLALDDQVGSYVWALRKLGLNVRGFVYHEMRKAFPEAPQKNKVVRLGCAFSKNKQQATDYDTYLETVSKEDTEAYEAGLYDDFLNFLKLEGIVFYSRHQIHKSDHECQQIEYGIGQEALEMTDPGLRIYPSPGRFSCGFCAFRQPCLGVFAGEDYMYTLNTLFERRVHYYLRTEPSTDTKGGE